MSRPSLDSAGPALHPLRAWTFELDGLQHRLELQPDSIWWGRPPAFRLDGARTRMPMGLRWLARRFEFSFSIAASTTFRAHSATCYERALPSRLNDLPEPNSRRRRLAWYRWAP